MSAPPITIIGGGIAGLMAALAAAPAPVRLLNPAGPGDGAASAWSQGGLAAAIGDDDSPDLHIADTLAAGAGLCDGAAVRRIVEAGPALIEFLVGSGVRFDRDAAQNLARGLEAAHQRPRILHANGDQTGAEIMRALIDAARATASIECPARTRRGKILVARRRDRRRAGGDRRRAPLTLAADRVLLATGGIGGLFRYSTNPPGAIGSGLMLAAARRRAAAASGIRAVPPHRFGCQRPGSAADLRSRARRRRGADRRDRRPLHGRARPGAARRGGPRRVRPSGRRASRVSRCAHDRRALCHPLSRHQRDLRRAGIDPATQPIPVRPAAHYHMGGVAVDARGRTSVPGLYAAGEVACTGLHGANRLASNSLLEAAVCGAQAGQDMAARAARPPRALPEAAPAAPAGRRAGARHHVHPSRRAARRRRVAQRARPAGAARRRKPGGAARPADRPSRPRPPGLRRRPCPAG